MNDPPEEAPRYLLIVREQLRPGTDEAYDENELKIARACAQLKCPHPYLALASMSGPREVWWLNAFASEEEKKEIEAAFARNERLMTELRPLGQRKEAFRQALTTTLGKHRPDLSGGTWRIKGARYFVVSTTREERKAAGEVFESPDGQRFVVSSAASRAAADRVAADAGPSAVLLALQPQWSIPAPGWIEADPDLWESNPVARGQATSPE